jgi:hypothetical protein
MTLKCCCERPILKIAGLPRQSATQRIALCFLLNSPLFGAFIDSASAKGAKNYTAFAKFSLFSLRAKSAVSLLSELLEQNFGHHSLVFMIEQMAVKD